MRYLYVILMLTSSLLKGQSYQLDTIMYHGDPDKYINIVIFGDGYTSRQLDTFLINAKTLTNYLFTQQPFSNYINYYNVFAIKVASPESGVKHPNTASDCQGQSATYPVTNPNNYFGTTFDYAGIHRLVVPVNGFNAISILSTILPQYDQIFFVANSPIYGGSGGSYATSSTHSLSGEVSVHELGHSFAGLADEYYAGDSYARETFNMTRTTDSNNVKWVNWYGDFGVGIYQHCCGGNSGQWYKPSQNCKMQTLNRPFCPVCRQTIVAEIDRRTNPIVRFLPQESKFSLQSDSIYFQIEELIKPIPNTLKVYWILNGQIVSNQNENFVLSKNQLNNGANYISANVIDTSSFLRIDNYSTLNLSLVQWTVTKTISDVEIVDKLDEVQVSLLPNPISSFGQVKICTKQLHDLQSLEVIALDGSTVYSIEVHKTIHSCYEDQINLSTLVSGSYILILNVDQQRISIPFSVQH